MRLRATLLAAAVGVALCTAAIAGAAQTSTDTISGYEYYATSTDGKFAGNASGALPGYWNADVRHTPLCSSCTPTATITGGSFSLATTVNGASTLITGTFTGGSVQLNPSSGTGCTNQIFAVNGILGSVGPWYSGSGTGSFSATLTHYRRLLFGNCITYSASVSGTLSLGF
jgi:hypothetical protein